MGLRLILHQEPGEPVCGRKQIPAYETMFSFVFPYFCGTNLSLVLNKPQVLGF